MKKLFFAMMACTMAFAGCGDNNEDGGREPDKSLVEDVVLPPATSSFAAGDAVTITAKGFTTSDAILFRMPMKAANASNTDIQAKVTSVTATSLTFEVPAMLTPGDNTLILKRSGVEMVLGKITIKVPEVRAAKLYGVGYGDKGDIMVLSEINQTTGALSEVARLKTGESMSSMVSIPGTDMIYGMNYSKDEVEQTLCSFNVTSKTYKNFTGINAADIAGLGVVDGQLHVLCFSDSNELTLKKIDVTAGTASQVASFGTFSPKDAQDFGIVDTPFVVKNGKLYTFCYIYDGAKELEYLMELDLTAKTIKWNDKVGLSANYLLNLGDRICACARNKANDIVEFFKVDAPTLTLTDKLGAMPDGYYDYFTYNPRTNKIFGCVESKDKATTTVGAYSLTDKTFSELAKDVYVSEIIVVE